MVDLADSHWGLQFRLAFLEKKGTEFQKWFVALAGAAWGDDFEPIHAHGREGDAKADGRRLSTKTIFQCYAPDRLETAKLHRKINSDFRGVTDAWPSWIKNWILVFNKNEPLPPSIAQQLDGLRSEHPKVTLRVWTEPQLLTLLDEMSLRHLEAMFGPAPSSADLEALTMQDIVPLLTELEEMEPAPGEEPLTQPPVDKLDQNQLSPLSRTLLVAGRRKQMLVDLYFRTMPRPDAGERIAEGFRRHYNRLKEEGRTPDVVFDRLRRYAGVGVSSRREEAALAVLSYFFERCDIFEDPEVGS